MVKRESLPDPDWIKPLPALYEPPADKGPVFPGKPHLQGSPAMQRSIMQIFDEFTDIISGELRSLNVQEFEREANRNSKH